MRISDKLEIVDEAMTIHMYDNGYMFEISGRKQDVDEYSNCKIITSNPDELIELIREAFAMPKNV